MKIDQSLNIILSILIGCLIFFVGVNTNTNEAPNLVYQVYLNGESLGLIDSRDALLDIIDEKQQSIKDQYQVSKVHPPSGLEITPEFTYSNEVKDAAYIYNLIEDKDPFTINGYVVTIKYPEEAVQGQHMAPVTKETQTLYVLHKEDFDEAFKTVVKAFIGPDNFDMYDSDTQPEIVEVGSQIESIYWEEAITIKESVIGVDALILTNPGEISKYLFFGTLEDQKYYKVKEGDSIDSISAAHNLNPDEFLVANPEFTSKNVLLTPGQSVNVSLIVPLVSIVSEVTLVEDITEKYKTEYVDNKNLYLGYKKTIQKGVNGLNRVTEKILYKNGEIQNLFITSRQEILPVINEKIEQGIKGNGGGQYYNTGGNETWSWPTNTPFVITSRYAPRWGSFHRGIDISGTGFGSPIRAVQAGTVTRNDYHSSYGNYIMISHPSGFTTLYAHMAKPAIPPVGSSVKREQIIGYMGSTGFSTGTHLHLEVRTSSGDYLDPCKSIFKC